MNPVEFVKQHPVAVGAAAVLVVGGMALIGRGGADGGETYSGGGDAGVEAGLALTELQMRYGSENARTAAEERVRLAEISASQKVAELTSEHSLATANLAAEVAHKELDVYQVRDTLAAQIRGQEIEAEKAKELNRETTLRAQISANAQGQQQERRLGLIGTIARGIFGFFTGIR